MRPLAEIYRKAGQNDAACVLLREDRAEWAKLARRWPLNGTDSVSEQAYVTKDLAGCAPPP